MYWLQVREAEIPKDAKINLNSLYKDVNIVIFSLLLWGVSKYYFLTSLTPIHSHLKVG